MTATADVLLVSSGVAHPTILARKALGRLLAGVLGATAGARRIQFSGLSGLHGLDSGRFALCVGYFHHKSDAPGLVDDLCRYVEAGGAYLAVHGAAASFKGNQAYEELLGGVFVRHGPITQLSVKISRTIQPEPAGKGAPTLASEAKQSLEETGTVSRFTVTDEPYEHRMVGESEIVARYSVVTAAPGENSVVDDQVCAWRRTVTQQTAAVPGRVAYLSLGHRRGTWKVGGVKALLSVLVGWCLREDGR